MPTVEAKTQKAGTSEFAQQVEADERGSWASDSESLLDEI